MEKLFFIAAMVCCTLLSANAQMKVYDKGYMRVGRDYLEEHDMGILPGYMDTTTIVRVWGQTESGAPARMSFGFQKYKNDLTVMVGERHMNGEDYDSNILWLHGKKGVCFTYNPQATDTILKFIPEDESTLIVNVPVKAPSFLVSSDARLKENVEPLEQSLDAISALSSVRYRLKAKETPDYAVDAETADMLEQQGRSSDNEFFAQYYAKRGNSDPQYGFIAQQVQEVLPELVHTGKDGYLSVDYISVIPLLVNAIQELKGRLEAIENGEEPETPVVNYVPATTGTDDITVNTAAEVLSQNDPNPFSNDTRIGFNLPKGTVNAAIFIYDLQGKQVKRLDVNSGETSVTLNGGDLQAGMYIYSLIADGKELASKKMILTK